MALKRVRKMVAILEAVHIYRVWFSLVDYFEKFGFYPKSNCKPKKISKEDTRSDLPFKEYFGCFMERRLQ